MEGSSPKVVTGQTGEEPKDDFVEHPTERLEEMRPRIDTQSSMPAEDRTCENCGQLEQTLESALAAIHDLFVK